MSDAPAVVLLGPGGLAAAQPIREALPDSTLFGPRRGLPEDAGLLAYDDIATCLRELYQAGRPIVALCAAGIVIRVLAPLVADKRVEPPVVAVAEDGSVAVPLLGGHRGANRLARTVADALGGRAAITTAGDVRFDLALDEPPPGFVVRNPQVAKPVMAALLDGRQVALRIEAGHGDWLTGGGAPFGPTGDLEVRVTDRDAPGSAMQLVIHPEVLALGVGCERGADPDEVLGLVEQTLADAGLARSAIACVGSLELKAGEPAIHAVAAALGVPLRLFDAAALEAEAPRLANPSDVVFAATGCHGVAEGAALALAGADAALVVGKTKSARGTCALARAPRADRSAPGWPSARPPHDRRARSRLRRLAYARGAQPARSGRALGRLSRLSRPPGAGAARQGAAWLRPRRGGKFGRVRRSILPRAVNQVALVSSGDAGIYAMASLVFELMERSDRPAWHQVVVEVSPGISALQAAAARAGAPLGHDFCAISLSDLLTPRSVIEQRLEAAAAGDFVTVLYNPASRQRREGLARALAILNAKREPDTPVVHARNLGRQGESVALSRLDRFDPATIDMLSLVIVGARQTRLVERPGRAAFVYHPARLPA